MPLEKLMLVRHGELPDEYKGKLVGRADAPLSSEGEKDCAALEKICRVFAPDKVYSSPLARALQSANLVVPDMPVAADERLAEMDFGKCCCLSFDEIQAKYPHTAEQWCDKAKVKEMSFPGGESVPGVRARVRSFIEMLFASGDKNVLVVTHGGIIVYLLKELISCAPDCEWDFLPSRGSASLIRFHGGTGHGILEFYNLTGKMASTWAE